MPRKKADNHAKEAPKRIFRRKGIAEPVIDDAEIARLKHILAEEENLEEDLRHDMEQIIRNRDRALAKQLKYIEERNRRMMMWTGVVLFMLIIALFWLASLRATTNSGVSRRQTSEQINTQETKENLTKVMNKVISGIEELKKQSDQINKATGTPSTTAPFTGLPDNK